MARKMKTMDGNTAAAHVSYAFTEVATIYPITPSSPMADYTDQWATQGRKNIFGNTVKLVELESEGGASGAFHGSLAAGALTTTYTASQGLLLMIPNMYKVAGELLPGVIDVSARALASHALSIFGDHQDIYACRQTGFAMLCSNSVQEVMDLGAVAHLAAIEGRVPFLHFFDGFRTSHEIQKVEVWDYEDLKEMCDMDAVAAFKKRALNPEHPVLHGSAQNPDIFFQVREACNPYYDAIPDLVEKYMNMVNAKIGTDYKPFNYVGAPDAEKVIIAMGSVCETIDETIDYMLAKGEKVGAIKVHLYRPFSAKHLLAVMPKSVKTISVIDRTKEPGSIGEPLYLDVVAALKGTEFESVKVLNGRYGLGSKNTTPADIFAIFANEDKAGFTVGIVDDVTNTSLPRTETANTAPAGTTSCKFWGLGADGTVGANKNSIKIIGDHTPMYAQAYFDYDSKKSGGVTTSHLRFGKTPIKSTYLIDKADFVACHCPAYMNKYDMVQDVKDGGTFLLNCEWSPEEVGNHIPGQAKRYMAEHNVKFYIIDGIKLGKEIGLGGRINTVLQSAFFKLANIIPEDEAIQYMKEKALASYAKKGDDIVQMNYQAIERGANEVVEVPVPAEWKDCKDEVLGEQAVSGKPEVLDFVNNIQKPINACQGDKLPVSTFKNVIDGTFPQGTAAYEKRGVAVDVPCWNSEGCLQCNQCAYVCPHAVIRPVVMNEEEKNNAPAGMKVTPMTGMPGYYFTMTVSVLDCTGCGSCTNVCPGNNRNDVLKMASLETQMDEQKFFEYGLTVSDKPEVLEKFKKGTVKGSQFVQPLLEFSGACAGCGETPYAKLITQICGDRMLIANATGCSSIWAGSSPSTPYTVNKAGKGPAWGNSLFEDNAEFGFGMKLAQDANRAALKNKLDEILASTDNADVKAAIDEYYATYEDGEANAKATDKLVAALEACGCDKAQEILKEKEFLSKKSQWIFGGDGWAYDIGYGGLDHVLAANKDVNVFVFDTEVYSNTGGQASKSTNLGAIAQFAAAGKDVKKKDLAAIAMSYGYIYVAQVAMGADMNQCVKAIQEAESYNGPSLVIGYAPCINHGIRKGMSKAMEEEKLAVQSGYWHLFRFDPRKALEGKNPFTLDSKAPTKEYQEFIMGESRYINLKKQNPERAAKLFGEAEANAKAKYEALVKRAED
ncbi:MAG: pyruvate:ferredoxin (flavodoxin) oxidoreductase [Lachnospira sp.]|jgi:pyruvate-ferredoxin/flavodoxin oxidoreductase|nr:pyruvate:ferredoxin (flavodoxin) oxidoreductase [Lachnospira sp.]MDD5830346.1 pyruvate:ferredoxin (flavodoxin) oxidoreductase [Lachnospira sp.]